MVACSVVVDSEMSGILIQLGRFCSHSDCNCAWKDNGLLALMIVLGS